MFLRLMYKESERSRKFKKSSLQMIDGPEALPNMREAALALIKQEGWYQCKIIQEPSGRVVLSDVGRF